MERVTSLKSEDAANANSSREKHLDDLIKELQVSYLKFLKNFQKAKIILKVYNKGWPNPINCFQIKNDDVIDVVFTGDFEQISPFQPDICFLYPTKTSVNQRLSDAFKWYKKGALA